MAKSQKENKMSASKDKAEGKKRGPNKPRDPNKPKAEKRTDVFARTFVSPGGKELRVYVKRLRSGGYETGNLGGADLKRGTPKKKYKVKGFTSFDEAKAHAENVLIPEVVAKNWTLTVKQADNYGGDEIPEADSF